MEQFRDLGKWCRTLSGFNVHRSKGYLPNKPISSKKLIQIQPGQQITTTSNNQQQGDQQDNKISNQEQFSSSNNNKQLST